MMTKQRLEGMIKLLVVICLLQRIQALRAYPSLQIRRTLAQYDEDQSPYDATGNTTNLEVEMHINTIDFDITQKTINLDMYLRLYWNDPRLATDQSKRSEVKGYMKFGDFNKLWKPDIFFRSLKDVKEFSQPSAQEYMALDERGNIKYVRRMVVSIHCPNLANTSPGGKYTCIVLIELFSSMLPEVSLNWKGEGVELESHMAIPDFALTKTDSRNTPQTYSTGVAPQLTAMFHFRRASQPLHLLIISTYVTSVLLVIISWITFWIDGTKVLERLVPGILIALVLALQSFGVAIFNKDSSSTAMDQWLFFCLALVLMTLLEFALAHVLLRFLPQQMVGLCRSKGNEETNEADTRGRCAEGLGRFIDVISGFLFPLVFIIFGVYFWSKY